MQKKLKMYLKYNKKTFGNLVTSNEIWFTILNQSGNVPTRFGPPKKRDVALVQNEHEG